ncbi:MAG: c-type cytochrome [Janthinobacterium lividum]
MKQWGWVLAVAGLTMSIQAQAAVDAARAMALAGRNACMGCHAVSRKLVGPSYNDVTARYKNDPAAVSKLTTKVLKGGAGAWGMIPMPSHPGMSQADAQTVVEWIMAGSPQK